MPNQLEQWFFDIPLVTRFYLTGAMALTFLVQIGWINYFDIYLNYDAIFKKHQYWKFIASFFYFGTFSFDWIWNMYFITKYSRMLEEESFSGRVGDFAWFMVLSAISIMISAPILELEVLAPAFTHTMTYIWSRRNPHLRILFLGAIPLTAPYLPYIFLLLNWLISAEFPKSHFIAIVIGHIYYFFEDVWPQQPGTNGVRYLKTPRWL
ncbi:Der1-like protein [Conidiobolus coronatus NRRL 28638]|uniref:Derlin n=1 Tax=Conidiobolus coronatus (strain ATCC 28846 / CBS 209.66 / NRRL 28638) TaxID=796925 RepID=A0A137P662_CONC2|nr:Der1-like protein [Conidiobolus coronatus NRRL 28638]|eukprot:KXN70502.1 Der1-like protein [Conidiobolus coronatus NRRL 28638]